MLSSPPTALGGSAFLTSHHSKTRDPWNAVHGLLLFLPRTPNPRINAFKPTFSYRAADVNPPVLAPRLFTFLLIAMEFVLRQSSCDGEAPLQLLHLQL